LTPIYNSDCVKTIRRRFNITQIYTKENLEIFLQDYYNQYGKSPTTRDLNRSGFPTKYAFKKYYGSLTNALNSLGLPLNKIKQHDRLNDTPDICECCGTITANKWYYRDNQKICVNCYDNSQYHRGFLSSESKLGVGVITEHVVSMVLNDCIKCNNVNSFNKPYDLISTAYGTINVKSSKLFNTEWKFHKQPASFMPDNYICIGFDKSRREILKVFIIPGNSNIVTKYGIYIGNSRKGLSKALEYEVNPEPYNKVYQELDIYTLPEFCNLNRE